MQFCYSPTQIVRSIALPICRPSSKFVLGAPESVVTYTITFTGSQVDLYQSVNVSVWYWGGFTSLIDSTSGHSLVIDLEYINTTVNTSLVISSSLNFLPGPGFYDNIHHWQGAWQVFTITNPQLDSITLVRYADDSHMLLFTQKFNDFFRAHIKLIAKHVVGPAVWDNVEIYFAEFISPASSANLFEVTPNTPPVPTVTTPDSNPSEAPATNPEPLSPEVPAVLDPAVPSPEATVPPIMETSPIESVELPVEPLESPIEPVDPPADLPVEPFESPIEPVDPPADLPVEPPPYEAPAEPAEPPADLPVEPPPFDFESPLEPAEPPLELPSESPIEPATSPLMLAPPFDVTELPAEPLVSYVTPTTTNTPIPPVPAVPGPFLLASPNLNSNSN